MAEPSNAMRELAREAATLDDRALLAQCDETFFVASGPGGQHRNKAATAVRLVHRPTGVTVTATERRSQAQNRSAALERLRQRLESLGTVRRKRTPTKPTRASQRRRLEAKKRQSRKKALRRPEW